MQREVEEDTQCGREREGMSGVGQVKLSDSKSNSVLARPFAGCRLVPRSVRLVDVRDLRHQRVVRVGVCEHRADREQHCNRKVSHVLPAEIRNGGKKHPPLEIVRAGLHWSRRMSRQMLPFELMLGW